MSSCWTTTPPGTRVGRLVVLGPGPRRRTKSGWRLRMLRVRCDCGRVTAVIPNRLAFYRSCGCRKGLKPNTDLASGYRHGGTGTPEWRAWCQMHQRCTNTKIKEFEYYGARGIRVCTRWHRFENFIADMGCRPSPKHSIDRKDNDKGYSKRNCRWATRAEQARNTSRNVWITIGRTRLVVADWTTRLGLPPFLVYSRLRAGWAPYDAVMRPRRGALKDAE